MNTMIKKPKRFNKRQNPLTRRFNDAYGQLSAKHKKLANSKFCQDFGVVSGTFNNKVSGTNPVAESEAKWMEAIADNPVVALRTAQYPSSS